MDGCFHLTRHLVERETFKWPSGLVIGFINQLVTRAAEAAAKVKERYFTEYLNFQATTTKITYLVCRTWDFYTFNAMTVMDRRHQAMNNKKNGWLGERIIFLFHPRKSHLSFHSVDCAPGQ